MNLMTIMYIAIQETLNDPEDMSACYGKLCRSELATKQKHEANRFGYQVNLKPSLVDYMLIATSKLRWDEQNVMPQTQVNPFFVLFDCFIELFLG